MRSTKRGWYRVLAANLAAITVLLSSPGNVFAAEEAVSDLIQEDFSLEETIDEEISLFDEEQSDVIDVEEESEEDADFEAVRRLKLSIATDSNATFIESSLQGAEKVGKEYYLGTVNENGDYSYSGNVSVSVKVADKYMLDAEKTNIVVTSAANDYTFGLNEDCAHYQVKNNVWTVSFDYQNADVPYEGDVKFNIATCPVASDNTFSVEGFSIHSLPEDSGLMFHADKKYHVLRGATGIKVKLSVPAGKMPKDNEFNDSNLAIYLNGEKETAPNYSCVFDHATGIAVFTYKFARNADGSYKYGNISVKPTLVASKDKGTYKFFWTSDHMKIVSVEGVIGKASEKSYFINTDAGSVSAEFVMDEGYMVDLDENGKPKGTINDKSWAGNENVTVSYLGGKFYFSYNFPWKNSKDAAKVTSVDIKPSVVTVKTANTFELSTAASSILSIDDEMAKECQSVIYEDGKYYLKRCEDTYTAAFRIDPKYAGKVNDTNITVRYGNQKLTADSGDYSLLINGDTVSVTVNRKYYTYNTKNEKVAHFRSGDIVVGCDSTPNGGKKTAYALSLGAGLYIDAEDPDAVSGMEYDTKTKKWYFLDETNVITANLKVSPGYYYERPEKGFGETVKLGKKALAEGDYKLSYKSDDNSFTFSYTFANDAKTGKLTQNNLSVAIKMEELIKVTLSYDADQLTLENRDATPIFSAEDKKAFYVRKGNSLSFTVAANDGYRISSVLKTKKALVQTDAVNGKESDEKGTYTIDKVTVAFTITAKAKALEGVVLRRVVDGTKEDKNCEVTIEGATDLAPRKTKKDPISDIYRTADKEIVITLKPAKNRVVYKVEAGNEELLPESDGTYIITKDQIHKWTEEKKAREDKGQTVEDVILAVTTDYAPVNVNVNVNGTKYEGNVIPGMLSMKFLKGAYYDRNVKGYVTRNDGMGSNGVNSEIKMKINTLYTYIVVDSVKYRMGNKGKFIDADKVGTKFGDYTYVIDREEVERAKEDQKEIFIEIVASKKDPKRVTFKTKEGVVYRYCNTDGTPGDVIDGTILVNYGTELNFMVALEDKTAEKYELKAVKCDSEVLTAKKAGNSEYYTLGMILDDKPVTIDTDLVKKKLPYQISIAPDGNVKSVRVFVDGTEIPYSNVLSIIEGSKVTLKVQCKDGYAFDKITSKNKTKLSVDGGEISFTVPENNETISIVTKKIKDDSDPITDPDPDPEPTPDPDPIPDPEPGEDDDYGMKKPTKIVVKGFKNGMAKVAVGTTKEFTVKAEKNTSYKGVKATVKNNVNATVTFDPNRMKLKVETFDTYALASENESIVFEFTGRDGKVIGSQYVIVPVRGKINAPSVKVIDVNDVYMTLSLSLPKGASDYTNLRYDIEATSLLDKKNPRTATGMKDMERVSVSSGDSIVRLKLSNDDIGNGQKYKINVCLVQYDGSNPYLIGKVRTVKKATKDPFEKKLSFSYKRSKLVGSQENVRLATVKYSKNTTRRSIVKAELYPNRSTVPCMSTETEELIINNDEVLLKDSGSLAPGKYVLLVYPVAKEGAGKPAKFTITVKAY